MLFVSFDDNLYWYRVVIYFVYNSARSANTKLYYLYTTETFPTTMRQSNMGTCSFFARIGSSLAPFARQLTEATHLVVVLALYLCMESLNLLLFLFVPETGDIQLPDTIAQKTKEVQLMRMSSKTSDVHQKSAADEAIKT